MGGLRCQLNGACSIFCSFPGERPYSCLQRPTVCERGKLGVGLRCHLFLGHLDVPEGLLPSLVSHEESEVINVTVSALVQGFQDEVGGKTVAQRVRPQPVALDPSLANQAARLSAGSRCR